MKPVLIQLGSFSLHTFGVLVGIGFLAGLWLAARRARAAGLDPEIAYDLAFPWILGGALVGARLLYVVSYWDRDFAGRPFTEVFHIWNGGLVYYGGLAGAVLAAVLRIRRLGLPLWRVGDALAPGIALGQAFGRLGCFFNGCCHGHPTHVPWAVTFPKGITPFDGPIHPSQLYETALSLLLCGGLVLLHHRRRFDGQVFAAYLLGYAGVRSLTEYFRGDYTIVSRPASGVLTPGQWASVVIAAAGIALWMNLRPARVPRTSP